MTDLPRGWERTTVGAVCDVVSGSTPKTSIPEYWGGDIPWLTPDDLAKNQTKILLAGRRNLTQAGYDSCSAQLMPRGSVLFSSRAPVGYVAIAGQEVCTNQGFKSAAPPRGLDSDYLYWFLRYKTPEIESRSSGTTFKEISRQGFAETELLLPPLAEQRRIVTALEDHLSRLAFAFTTLDKAAVRMSKLRESVLSRAAAGALVEPERTNETAVDRRSTLLTNRSLLYSASDHRGRPNPVEPNTEHAPDFPPSWSVVSLEQATHPVRTISYGILKPGPNLPNGIPYVRVVNMRGNRIAMDDLHRTSSEIDKQYARARLAPYDLLISIRGTYGRIAIVPPQLSGANITQDTARLGFLEDIDPEFALLYLCSPQAQHYLKRVARGVAVKGVNVGALREMPFPVPTLREQRRIVERANELFWRQESTSCGIQAAQTRSHSLRRSLLTEAFAGRLVAQDPNDEPASELLARIHAERDEQPPQRRSRRPSRTATGANRASTSAPAQEEISL